jgi:hypothetical protein
MRVRAQVGGALAGLVVLLGHPSALAAPLPAPLPHCVVLGSGPARSASSSARGGPGSFVVSVPRLRCTPTIASQTGGGGSGVDGAGSGMQLPFSGFDLRRLLAQGVGLVACGGLLLGLVGRRRRHARHMNGG